MNPNRESQPDAKNNTHLEAFDERVDYLKSIVDGDSKLVLTDTVAATVSILPGLTEDAKAVRLIYVTDGVSNGREDTPEMLNWNDRKSSTLEDVRSEAQRQAGRLSACESVRVSFIGTGSPVAGRENPGKPVTGIKPEVYTNAKLFWQSVFEGCGGELLSWQ